MLNKLQFLIIFLTLFLTGLHAQDYQINFTGSGLSTTVDSVQVTNIAKGTSVTVKSSDGLQLVVTSTDIEYSLPRKGDLRIFPNPMTEASVIEFLNFSESQVNIEVFDITGKIVIRYKLHLLQGHHRFEI
jgi:hypothetical protein